MTDLSIYVAEKISKKKLKKITATFSIPLVYHLNTKKRKHP